MGVWLLENKVSSHIQFEQFHTNACKTTINEILTEIHKIVKAFEAYILFSQGMAGDPNNKPNIKKCFSRKAEVKNPQGVDEVQINAFGSKKPNAKAMKCFNCGGSGHSAKESQKPKNKCPDCQFLDSFHKKEC